MRMSELSAFTQDPSGTLKAPFSRYPQLEPTSKDTASE